MFTSSIKHAKNLLWFKKLFHKFLEENITYKFTALAERVPEVQIARRWKTILEEFQYMTYNPSEASL